MKDKDLADRYLGDLAFASEMITRMISEALTNKRSNLISRLETLRGTLEDPHNHNGVFGRKHEFRRALEGIFLILKRRRWEEGSDPKTIIKELGSIGNELKKKKSKTYRIAGQTWHWSLQNLESQILRQEKFPEAPDSKSQKRRRSNNAYEKEKGII